MTKSIGWLAIGGIFSFFAGADARQEVTNFLRRYMQ
jgi:hypothetical protein